MCGALCGDTNKSPQTTDHKTESALFLQENIGGDSPEETPHNEFWYENMRLARVSSKIGIAFAPLMNQYEAEAELGDIPNPSDFSDDDFRALISG